MRVQCSTEHLVSNIMLFLVATYKENTSAHESCALLCTLDVKCYGHGCRGAMVRLLHTLLLFCIQEALETMN